MMGVAVLAHLTVGGKIMEQVLAASEAAKDDQRAQFRRAQNNVRLAAIATRIARLEARMVSSL